MRSGITRLLFVICCFCWTIPVVAQTLHLVIVADVNSNLRSSVTADRENIAQLFSDNIPQHQLKIITFEPRELTSARIKQKIAGLNVGTSDTVVFYYSGHGAYDSRGHYFAIQDPLRPYISEANRGIWYPLYFSEIQEAVKRHQPRLAVFIRDCCFVNMESGQDASTAAARSVGRVPTTVTPLFDHLFFRQDGVVDMMAAEKSYPSWGFSHGGIFTLAFVTNLYIARDTQESWDDIFTKVISGTRAIFVMKFTYNDGAALMTTSWREIMDDYKNGRYGEDYQLLFQHLESRQVPVIQYSLNTANSSQPSPRVSAGNGNDSLNTASSSQPSPRVSVGNSNQDQSEQMYEPVSEPKTIESDCRSSCTYVQPFRQYVPYRCRLLFRWKACFCPCYRR